MFLRQLSSRGSPSSFLSLSRAAVSRATGFRGGAVPSSRHQHVLLQPPAPPPWWPSWAPPPWPLCSSQPLPARAPLPQGFVPRRLPAGLRPLFTSAVRQMEPPDRGPSHKRRRSTREKERSRSGSAGPTQEAVDSSEKESKRRPGTNHCGCRTRGPEDRGANRPEGGALKEYRSDWKKEGSSGAEGVESRGSNWYRARGAGGRQAPHSWYEDQSREPHRTTSLPPQQHLQRGGAAREPPPPGTSSPLRHQEAPLARRKIQGSRHGTPSGVKQNYVIVNSLPLHETVAGSKNK